MASLKVYLQNLNFFKSNSDSDYENIRRYNTIASRIYLIVLGIILIVVAIGLWINPQTTIITLNRPTINQTKVLPSEARCPCSRISISYGDFTSIETRFHQVCSSDFISDRWIRSIYPGPNITHYRTTDFRFFGSAQFQALSGFCRLSYASVIRNIATFNSSTLISPQVLSETVLLSQTQAFFNEFLLTALNAFQAELSLVRQMNFIFLSGLQSNYFLRFKDTLAVGIEPVVYNDIQGKSCNCFGVGDCRAFTNIYDLTGQIILMKIPGIYASCLPVNSMVLSTLECFYNQTCIDMLMFYLSVNENFTAMTIMNDSRFQLNSTVQSIVDYFMVEEWTNDTSYEKYYNQCAPNSCTYSKVERHNGLFVLAKIIGLLGGLTLVLELIISRIVKFLLQRKNSQQTPKITRQFHICIRFHELRVSIMTAVRELNLFKQDQSNDRQAHYQRIATRSYIILIVFILAVLAIYTFLNKTIYRETIINPSMSQYLELQQNYSTTLSCPCSSISVTFSNFMIIRPHYHQLCSSDLVSSRWISYLFMINGLQAHYRFDYRLTGGSFFKSCAFYCQSAKQTVDSALNVFLQTQFVSGEVLSPNFFESQSNSLIENWQTTLAYQFIRTIDLMNSIGHGNQEKQN